MEPFLGQVMMFAGNFAPRGWAFCEGQLLPISQYSALFSILGTTWGGDGRTTFGLPDLRGRVSMGAGSGPGLSDRRIGQKLGEERHTLVNNEIPPHSHSITPPALADVGTLDEPSNAYPAANDNGDLMFASTHDANLATYKSGNDGGGQAHNNMQPSLCINYIIALQGVFPSRS